MTSPLETFDMYDASFDGAEFMEIFSGFYAPEPDSGVDSSETKIPGGSKVVVQISGAGIRRLDLPIACSLVQLDSLRSKADNYVRDTLDYHAGDVSARLMQVVNVRKQGMDDSYLATLRFVMG